jgi:hypothetical protein
MRSTILLLSLLAAAGAEPRRALLAPTPTVAVAATPAAVAAGKLEVSGADRETEVVQEAVKKQSAYDAQLYAEQHNAAGE